MIAPQVHVHREPLTSKPFQIRRMIVRAVTLASITFFLPAHTARAQSNGPTAAIDFAAFQKPPVEYRGRTMMGLNLQKDTVASIQSAIRTRAKQQLYGGAFLVVGGASGAHLAPSYVHQANPHLHFAESGTEYMSEDFFNLYRAAVEEARRDRITFVLYDDYAYPTGTVAGQIFEKYPQFMAKRLDMVEADRSGPGTVELKAPEGTYIGAVLLNRDNHKRIDVSNRKTSAGLVRADVPQGNWKLMVFYLNHEAVLKIRNPGFVDYLDPDAMDKFIALSYGRFYSHLKPYFGSTIKMSFFDEPTLHWLDGRTWTGSFNSRFSAKYGYSPMQYYPALWYDIGPETAAARNALYGFRAELFSQNFVGKITQWCHDHGIQSSGHLDQEEVPNPVTTNGDLMKAFKHEDIPGADDIAFLGRSNRGYKVVTSAASNFDKPVVMAETYAAYEKIDNTSVFQTAMDQFAMGINLQLPWDGINRRITDAAELNEYVGRLSYLLQHGRHAADIAVLYPIAALQSAYSFKGGVLKGDAKLGNDLALADLAKDMGSGWEYAYKGGVPPPEIDYMDIGELLFRGFRTDYTYLHPEVLAGNTVIQNKRLVLNNKENREEFRVLIVPGGDTISLAAARRIEEFYKGGGIVIATSRLPHRSAEFGKDQDVQSIFSRIFKVRAEDLVSGTLSTGPSGYLVRKSPASGQAYFLLHPTAAAMTAVLKQVLPVRDVAFNEPMWPLESGHDYHGALTYIHKVKAGHDIYFFANSSTKPIHTDVVLRGAKHLAIWDPHTGEKRQAETQAEGDASAGKTRLTLVLPPVHSLFYISQ